MKGLLAPKRADWERKGAVAPFVKALENKKSSRIALRLNSYQNKILTQRSSKRGGGLLKGLREMRSEFKLTARTRSLRLRVRAEGTPENHIMEYI
jgi:hypothetical protein